MPSFRRFILFLTVAIAVVVCGNIAFTAGAAAGSNGSGTGPAQASATPSDAEDCVRLDRNGKELTSGTSKVECTEATRPDGSATVNGGLLSSWTVVDDVVTGNNLPLGAACTNGAAGSGAGLDDANLPNGQSDAFDYGAMIWVNDTQVSGALTHSGNTTNFAPVSIAGLNVSMQYYFASASATQRTLVTFTNSTGAPITVPVSYATNFGSDSSTTVKTTSSGDAAFTLADRWIVTDDSNASDGDPANATVIAGPNSPAVVPAGVSQTVFECSGAHGAKADYSVTVNPGQTRHLMMFQKMNDTAANAVAEAPTFFNSNPAAGGDLLSGLTATQLGQIANWNFVPPPPTIYLASVDGTTQPFSKYDVNTNTWTQLGTVASGGQLATSPSGQLYMLNWATNFIQVYDPVGNAWSNVIAGPPGGPHSYANLEVTTNGEFFLSKLASPTLHYTQGGVWQSFALPAQAAPTGDYDPLTNQLVIGRRDSDESWRINASTLALTTFNAGALSAGEARRFGEIVGNKYYTLLAGNPVKFYDLSNPATPITSVTLPTEQFFASAAGDDSTGVIYIAGIGTAWNRTGLSRWNPQTNVLTPLAPMAAPVANMSTIALVGSGFAPLNPPSIVASAAATRQRGSAAAAATVATVSDNDQAAGTLTVAATAVPAGITVTNVANNHGAITANIAASCSAAIGANTVVFTVTDANGNAASSNFTVNVSANAAPTLSYPNASAPIGGSTTINPGTGPSDNGSVASIALKSQGTYTGGISVNNSTGVITITGAGPIGNHLIEVRATDNCGATNDVQFALNVAQPAGTTTTITNAATLAATPSSVGQPYAVNFTVSPVASGPNTPTGTVMVSDGSATCSATIAANGTGSCSLTSTSPGNKTITAGYAGNGTFTASTDAGVSHQVVMAVNGNVKQFVQNGTNTNLAGITVALAINGTHAATAVTDAGGNYAFGVLSNNANLVLTPSGAGRTFEAISRSYSNVTSNVDSANYIAYNSSGPGGNPRELRVVNTVATPGQPVAVPVELASLGNEMSFSFTLAYDQALAGVPTGAACGSGFTGCTVTEFNTSTAGRVGVTVNRPTAAVAGLREIVRITFPTTLNTAASAALAFADSPVLREMRNGGGNPVPAFYSGGFISFTPDLEGDVVKADGTSPGGDGVLSNDVTIVRSMALGIIQPTAAQFRSADTAPRATLGDGCPINATDVTQAARYNLGLDPPTVTGGSAAEIPGGCAPTNTRGESDEEGREDAVSRVVRAVITTTAPSQQVVVPFQLDSQGDEASLSFTVNFDPAKLTYVSSAMGAGTPAGTNLAVNTSQIAQGRLGVLLDATNSYAQGTRQILTVTFTTAANFSGSTPVTFSSTPTPESVSGSQGVLLATSYAQGFVTFNTAAGASIAGRVTNANGQGIRNATVTITDASGIRRTATTGSFGSYTFTDVEAGVSYVVAVTSKRFRFAPQVVNLSDSLADVDFAAME